MLPSINHAIKFIQEDCSKKINEALNLPNTNDRIDSLRSIIHGIKNNKEVIAEVISTQKDEITKSNQELKATKQKISTAAPAEKEALTSKIEQLSEIIVSLDEKIKEESPTLFTADLALKKAENSLLNLENNFY